MTTLYLFHQFIEATETADTVLSLFGQWWDGDASGLQPDILPATFGFAGQQVSDRKQSTVSPAAFSVSPRPVAARKQAVTTPATVAFTALGASAGQGHTIPTASWSLAPLSLGARKQLLLVSPAAVIVAANSVGSSLDGTSPPGIAAAIGPRPTDSPLGIRATDRRIGDRFTDSRLQ